MDTTEIITNLILYVLGAATVFIVPKWASAVINYGTKHKYDEMMETIKDANQTIKDQQKIAREVKMKAAIISELASEWISRSKDRKRLRELTFEAFLWLPNELAVDLSKILSHKPDAIDIREFLVKVRIYLGMDDGFESWRVITFPLSEEESK